ncbi:MAG: DEAD/DEAH box helicase [Myxococcota bacterium]
MTTQDTQQGKGPGQGGRGRREGFSFGDRKEGRGGRDGRDGRGGRDRRGGAGGGASFRIVTELSSVEKALTKLDFASMQAPLGEILRALKPLHLKSLEDLDLNTRGKLITSLMRVVRAPKPKPAEGGEAAPAAMPAEAAPAEAAPADSAPADSAPADSAPAGGAEAAPTETPAETAPAEAAPVAPAKPAVDPAIAAWAEALFTVGLIWRAVNDVDRAQTAFDAAGRQPTEADLAAPPQRADRPERSERPGRGPREKGPRGERPERGERREARSPFTSSGDWQADAQRLEEMGRTRDAGRIHEKHQSYAAAARLFELGGDLKAALRNAVLGKVDELFTALSAKVKPDEVVEVLQRAQAWDKLMEFHVARSDFDAIARLYERARQFDQAGLAWERAGKLSLARKAYERAKDTASATRVRDLEVTKLAERGDKLGAATLLVGAGRTADALELLKTLPGPKAYHFMEKLKLKDEAKAYAQAELRKAEAENNAPQKARWLELLGDLQGAAATWLAAERKDKAASVFEQLGDLPRAAQLLEAAGQLDKAQALFEKLGDTANAERVKALARPEPKPKPAKAQPAAEGEGGTAMPPPSDRGNEGPRAPGATA